MNYKLEGYKKIYNSPERKLRVGYIVECNKGNNYGIIYSFDSHYRYGLFWFNKTEDEEFEEKTIISFIVDYSAIEKNNYQVSNITALSQYQIFNIIEKSEKETYYKTNTTSTMDKMIESAQMFLSIYTNDDCIYGQLCYPIIDHTNKSIQYFFIYCSVSDYPKNLMDYYLYIQANKGHFNNSNFDDSRERLMGIIDYVNNLTLDYIVNQFVVEDVGIFQCNPGKDDKFFFEKDTRCMVNDKYLFQLTELKSEIVNYYNCLGQGEEEKEFRIINEKETKILREEIRKRYDQGKHLFFLINDYIEKSKKITDNVKRVYETIHFLFKEEKDKYIFMLEDMTQEQWMKYIEKYNRQR